MTLPERTGSHPPVPGHGIEAARPLIANGREGQRSAGLSRAAGGPAPVPAPDGRRPPPARDGPGAAAGIAPAGVRSRDIPADDLPVLFAAVLARLRKFALEADAGALTAADPAALRRQCADLLDCVGALDRLRSSLFPGPAGAAAATVPPRSP